MDKTFYERRSERPRRYEERRVAQERYEALLCALTIAAPILAAWAACWAISYAMTILP